MSKKITITVNDDFPEELLTPISGCDKPFEISVKAAEKLGILQDYYGASDWSAVTLRLAIDLLPGFKAAKKNITPTNPKGAGARPDTISDIRFLMEMRIRLEDGQTQGQAAKHIADKFPELAKSKRAAEDRYRNIKKNPRRLFRIIELFERIK